MQCVFTYSCFPYQVVLCRLLDVRLGSIAFGEGRGRVFETDL